MNKITIVAEPFDWRLFEEQVDLFNAYWYTTKVHYEYELGDPVVDIIFTHSDNNVCYEAASSFVNHVRELDWWVEYE
jgi:hypothetical protein